MVTLLSTKGFTMTENNKPEWFEIAENDGPTAPPKASKTLPVLAVFATALILGIGAVVAQVQDNSPASAVDAANVQTEATSNATSQSPTEATNNATSQSPMTDPSVGSSVSSTSGLKNPAIAQLPTKGDDDDEDEDEEDDEEDDD
jgi:hypothetical protein